MAFQVNDLKDLLQLLDEHPEWLAEVRQRVLTAELLALPAVVQQGQARTDEHLTAIEEHLAAVDERLLRSAAAQARTDERLDALTGRLDVLTQRVDALTQRVDALVESIQALQRTAVAHQSRLGTLEGKFLEWEYRQRAPAYFATLARRIQVIDSSRLATMLDDAVDAGTISLDERDETMWADVVTTGRRREDGVDIFLVAEVPVGVGIGDVTRAPGRAAIMEKLGRPAIPVVAGHAITREAAVYAQTLGVVSPLVPPRSAGDEPPAEIAS